MRLHNTRTEYVDEMIARLRAAGWKVQTSKPSWRERITRFFGRNVAPRVVVCTPKDLDQSWTVYKARQPVYVLIARPPE